MKKVGLTGGIASGKSLVAGVFLKTGVPVYFADKRARELMESDEPLKTRLKQLLGEKAFEGNLLNKKYVAECVFHQPMLRNQMNALVHPVVWKDWESWVLKQEYSYCIIESALLFQTGLYSHLDAVVVVNASEAVRKVRLSERDRLNPEEAELRIKNQEYCVPEESSVKKFFINNHSDNSMLLSQVLEIKEKLLQL